jgi:hypothetical protein
MQARCRGTFDALSQELLVVLKEEPEMPLGPRFAQEMAPPFSALDAAAIREQLERLLAHPLFCNSKRYPVLLAYTVEETLKGNGAELKERSIGIEVFGRSPSYDANADPVVRITAGEVRKRLMQYYYDSAHDGEVVLELPVGSYVPLFHLAEPPAEPELPAPASESPAMLPVPPVRATAAPRSTHRLLWLGLVLLAAVSGAVGFDIASRHHAPPRLPARLIGFGLRLPTETPRLRIVWANRPRTSVWGRSTPWKRRSLHPTRSRSTSVCTTPACSRWPT